MKTQDSFKPCPKCKGKGSYSAWLMDLGKREKVWHEYIMCDFPTCENGYLNPNKRVKDCGCLNC